MVAVFFSYSHQDERFRDELEKHFSLLKREGLVRAWHDRRISVGSDIDQSISDQLEASEVILLLVSSDFLASDYCWGVEVRRALERHEAGAATVIPIILRPCEWHRSPFGNLLACPTDGKPVVRWSNRDAALLDITTRVRDAIADGLAQRGRSFVSPSDAEADRQEAVEPIESPHEVDAMPARTAETRVGAVIITREKEEILYLAVKCALDWCFPTRQILKGVSLEHTAKRAAEDRLGRPVKVLAELVCEKHVRPEWELSIGGGTFAEEVIETSWRQPIAVLIEGTDLEQGRPLLGAMRDAVVARSGSIHIGIAELNEGEEIAGIAKYEDTPLLFVFANGVPVHRFDKMAARDDVYKALIDVHSDIAPHYGLAACFETTYFLVEGPFRSAEAINAESRGAPVQWFEFDELIESRIGDWDIGALGAATPHLYGTDSTSD